MRVGDATYLVLAIISFPRFSPIKFPYMDIDIIEPRHEISNNVVCATSKGLDQPAHMRSLIRAFASRLNIL